MFSSNSHRKRRGTFKRLKIWKCWSSWLGICLFIGVPNGLIHSSEYWSPSSFSSSSPCHTVAVISKMLTVISQSLLFAKSTLFVIEIVQVPRSRRKYSQRYHQEIRLSTWPKEESKRLHKLRLACSHSSFQGLAIQTWCEYLPFPVLLCRAGDSVYIRARGFRTRSSTVQDALHWRRRVDASLTLDLLFVDAALGSGWRQEFVWGGRVGRTCTDLRS